MTLVLAAAVDTGLIFAADSKIQWLAPDDGHVEEAIGSKITLYTAPSGMLAVGYAGMWVAGTSEEQYLELLNAWTNSGDPLILFAEALAAKIAQPLTAASAEHFLNASEFLVGWVGPEGTAELFHVASNHAERIANDVVFAIGGSGEPGATQQYRRIGSPIDAAFILEKLDETMKSIPSSAYDFPIQVVEVVGPHPSGISVSWYGPGREQTSEPNIRRYLPPRWEP